METGLQVISWARQPRTQGLLQWMEGGMPFLPGTLRGPRQAPTVQLATVAVGVSLPRTVWGAHVMGTRLSEQEGWHQVKSGKDEKLWTSFHLDSDS